MPMKKYTSLTVIALFSFAMTANAQLLIDLNPKLFTLRNARFTAGSYIAINFVSDTKGGSIMNHSIGSLPDDVMVRFDTTMLPSYSIGIKLDFFAPNSIIGFALGGEYQATAFQLHAANFGVSSFNFSNIRFPGYLKFQLGKVHAPKKGLLMFGGIYSFPIFYKRSSNSIEFKDLKETQSTWSLSSIIGWQVRLSKQEKMIRVQESTDPNIKTIDDIPSRTWFFFRVDLLMKNAFDFNSNTPLVANYSAGQIDYRDLNITIGAAVFMGSKKR